MDKCKHNWELIALVDFSDDEDFFPDAWFLNFYKGKKCGETKKEDLGLI